MNEPESAPLLLANFILPIGVLGISVALSGWLALSPKWKSQLIAAQSKESQIRQDKEESQTRKIWRGLQTLMACWGCHIGLSMILAFILIFADAIESSINIMIGYMMFSWLPTSVILFPLIYRKLN